MSICGIEEYSVIKGGAAQSKKVFLFIFCSCSAVNIDFDLDTFRGLSRWLILILTVSIIIL